MPVFVDNYEAPFGRMKLSHMMADTEEELHAMADALGLKREWFQGDHYDISKAKRDQAISLGAKLISPRMMASFRRELREGGKRWPKKIAETGRKTHP